MKKTYMLLAAAAILAAAVSCNKEQEILIEDPANPTNIQVNITVGDMMPGTKAIKTGWANGDILHVYLDDNVTITPDFDLTYDGTKWTASAISAAVEARLKASSGKLDGFWESSNSCMSSASWEKGSDWMSFPERGNIDVTGVMGYLVADFSNVDYTYDGSTLTASISTWQFRSDAHIVVTGLTGDSWTLYSDDIDNMSSISFHNTSPSYCWVGYYGTGAAYGKIRGIPNADGLAFVGGWSKALYSGSTLTLYLKDNSSSKIYTFSKVLTSDINPNNATIKSIKIPFSKFVWGGKFTVNGSGGQVYFSQGNLQYQASTATWRFAEHQYDYIGDAVGNSTTGDGRATQADWIDLFGWGTSGYENPSDDHDVYYHPWDITYSTTTSSYGPSSVTGFDDSGDNLPLVGDLANYDWGVYNAIGSYPAGTWHTMTAAEWQWLLWPKDGEPNPGTNCRTSSTVNSVANARFAMAIVNSVNGLIVFPDIYTHPDGVTQPESINVKDAHYTSNSYNVADWGKMEAAGAVFLPAAGYRSWYKGSDTKLYSCGEWGVYWSRTCGSNAGNTQSGLMFHDSSLLTYQDLNRCRSQSVRLVRYVE